MIVPVLDAKPETCGGKAAALGALLRAGLPVPDGFVVPFDAFPGGPSHRAVPDPNRQPPIGASLLDALKRGLAGIGDPPVAVRSSAANEDTATASAAGQHDSVLGVRGLSGVAAAVRTCWASLHSQRASDYRSALDNCGPIGDGSDADGPDAERPDHPPGDPVMAVLVQRLVDAEVSGVMFTPGGPGGTTEIEASWGLGPSVVGGIVTPDAFRVAEDGSVTRTVAEKKVRLDRHGTQLVTHEVPVAARTQPSIDDATAVRLARLGHEVAAVLVGAQDIEWAIADGKIWLLQARPVTAAPPSPSPIAMSSTTMEVAPMEVAPMEVAPAEATTAEAIPAEATTTEATQAVTLFGTPGSHGTATGTARIVRGPGDFARVRPGDILVCPYTDPAWTPLLRVAAGVVTEAGGVLSHAAIVARERHIPAVLGVRKVTTKLADGTTIVINGTTGTVTTA